MKIHKNQYKYFGSKFTCKKINISFGLSMKQKKKKNYSILVLNQRKSNNYIQTYLHYLNYHKWW